MIGRLKGIVDSVGYGVRPDSTLVGTFSSTGLPDVQRSLNWVHLATRFPDDTIVQFNYLPTIHAAAWLRSSDPAKALESLTSAVPYELGGNFENLNFVLYPVYLRGEAYLAEKQGAAAAAEFQKILDHPGVVRNEPIGALAHLELGRAYVLSGDTAKGKSAYKDFLTLWKDADPDIPILKEAKAEYSKLQ